jgi:hypothetical protein
MTFLQVPKRMKWKYNLSQTHFSNKSILITSGCSFTASTQQLDSAASWPGYVRDRCRFDYCIDYSYPGSGNEYIGDSILHHFSEIDNVNDYFVIIMWSGIDRKEEKIKNIDWQPKIGDISYQRSKAQLSHELRCQYANESADKMFKLYKYLTERNISFVFTSYVNLLFPPYIPKRDNTVEFDNLVDVDTLTKLKSLPWVPTNPMDYLYEYAFVNDYLTTGDYFHPPVECNLLWTDNILLPTMVKQGFIQ